MPAITEIVNFTLISADAAPTVSDILSSTLLKQPGCQRVRWSLVSEDSSQARSFIDWDDLSDHKTFMVSEAYPPFLQAMAPHMAARPGMHHVAFNPPVPTPVLSGTSPVVELLYTYFPGDESFTAEMKDDAMREATLFLNEIGPKAKGATGQTAIGWTNEKVEFQGEECLALCVFVGWESLEAHLEFRSSDLFKENIPQLRGIKGSKGASVVHVSPTTVERGQ